MEKLSTFATKREQHRIEIRAEKLKSLLSLKRQKFTIISPLNEIKNCLEDQIKTCFLEFYTVSKQKNEILIVETLKKMRMLISDEGSSELMRKEIFQTEIYKDLLEFLTPLFYKSQTLLIEVIWISINLTCIEDSKKLALLFKEKLIEKLIVLIKYDENNTILNPDILWCLCNIISISEEAKHDIANEGVLEIAFKLMKSKDLVDQSNLKNFVVLYYHCSLAQPPIKYEIMKKYFTTVFLIIRTQHDNDILYAAIMAISSVFTSYEEFVEENIHLFFSMKGLGLLKDMMDNKNTPKNLLAALLKIVGSIANGNEIAVQALLDHGLLKNINEFLNYSSIKIRHLSTWALSNIISSTESIATKVFSFEDIFERLLKNLIICEEIVKLESLYCIHGILTYKTQKPIDFLLERNAIKIMINLVKETKSSKIILLILDSLCKFLEFEEHTNKNYKKLIENMLEESEGFQILDELQHHPDDAVFAKLESLIKQHFDSTTS